MSIYFSGIILLKGSKEQKINRVQWEEEKNKWTSQGKNTAV